MTTEGSDMEEKKATFIKTLNGFTGDASLYRLSPKLKVEPSWEGDFEGEFEYVVVSATVAMFSGSETYIFPSDENGEVVDWGELEGSFRGALDHKEALAGAGYSLEGG